MGVFYYVKMLITTNFFIILLTTGNLFCSFLFAGVFFVVVFFFKIRSTFKGMNLLVRGAQKEKKLVKVTNKID